MAPDEAQAYFNSLAQFAAHDVLASRERTRKSWDGSPPARADRRSRTVARSRRLIAVSRRHR
jgi:hypothetical protein